MKFRLLIVAAAVLAIAACKTPYKATDRSVPSTDSTAAATDTAMNKMPVSTDDTTNISQMDSARMDSISQPVPDTTQNLPKTDSVKVQPGIDSAVNNTGVDSTKVSPAIDTAMAKPILDSTTKIKSDADSAKTTPAIDTSSASSKAPIAVEAAFTKQYPGATNVVWSSYDSLAAVPIDMRLTGWKKMDEQDHMAKFEFENGTYYAWYDSNGKWIGSASPMTDITALPAAVSAAVKNAIKTRYAGYSVSQVNREFQTGKKSYEVELAKDDNKVRMMVSSTGKIGQIYRYKTEKK